MEEYRVILSFLDIVLYIIFISSFILRFNIKDI